MYRASAGTVYPTLQQLEDEGLVQSDTQDSRRTYRLTPEGVSELEREKETVERIWKRAKTLGNLGSIDRTGIVHVFSSAGFPGESDI